MAEGFKLLDAYVEVKADGKGVADKVAGDIERESGGSSRLGRTGSSMGGNLLGGLKGAFSVGAVGGLVGGVVGSVTSGLTSLIGSAVSDIGGMLLTVGADVASTVVDFNSQLESANIGFTTMLGSGAKAKGFLADLQAFAKATPFDFGGLVHSAQNMLGMGIAAKDVIPDLTALGDAVASVGGSATQVDQVTAAFSQMSAKGTVDLGNMYQVINGGVSHAFDYMAAGLHVTTGKLIAMISAGDVASSKALPALVRGIEKGTKSIHGLGGMMDQQSRTFSGALSNIQDAFTQTTAKAFKPFFDAASKGMQHFATALSGKPVEKFTKDVQKVVQPFAKQIEKWLAGIDFNKIFKNASKALRDLTKGLNAKDFGKFLKDMTKDAGDIFKDIVKVAPKVITMFKEIAPAVMATIKQLVNFTGSVADFIDGLNGMEKGFTKWHDANKSIKLSMGQLGSFVSDRGKSIQTTFGQIGSFISDRAASIRTSFSQIASFFADRVHSIQVSGQQLVAFFGGLPGQLATIGEQMVSGLVGGFKNAFGSALSTFTGLVNLIPLGIRKLLGIASPSKVFHTIGQQVGQGLHLGLLGSVDQIKVASGKLADAVKDAFSGQLETTMVRRIGRMASALEKLSTSRDKAAGKLADAKSNLSSIIADRASFAANVKSGVMGNADTSSIFGTSMQDQRDARQKALDDNAALTPTVVSAGTATLNGNSYQPSWTTTVAATLAPVPKVSAHTGLLAVKASLKTLLADTKKFAANLRSLAKLGIDPYTYDELVQAGVRGGGLETSDAMLKDKTLAKSIFTLERQIGAAGQGLGNRAASHEYAGQVRSARTAVATDQRTVNHINVQMVVEAKKIDEVQKLVDMVSKVKQTARKGKK